MESPIKKMREAKNLSIYRCAKTMGVHPSSWKKYETSSPSINTLEKICEAMGWELSILIQ